VHVTTSFDSPFRGEGSARESTKIPDFSHYKTKSSENSNLMFQYFMVGTMGALTAAGAKATVQGMFGSGTEEEVKKWLRVGERDCVEMEEALGGQLG
jgi:hypothetical protein